MLGSSRDRCFDFLVPNFQPPFSFFSLVRSLRLRRCNIHDSLAQLIRVVRTLRVGHVCHYPEYQNQTANSQIGPRSKYQKSRRFPRVVCHTYDPPVGWRWDSTATVLNRDLTPFFCMCLHYDLVWASRRMRRRICFAELLMVIKPLQRKSNCR